jgi:hypothetical protein
MWAGLKILVSAVAVLLPRCYLELPPTARGAIRRTAGVSRKFGLPREQASENVCYHTATIRCRRRPSYGPHGLGLFLLFPCGWSVLVGGRNAVVARASWPCGAGRPDIGRRTLTCRGPTGNVCAHIRSFDDRSISEPGGVP